MHIVKFEACRLNWSQKDLHTKPLGYAGPVRRKRCNDNQRLTAPFPHKKTWGLLIHQLNKTSRRKLDDADDDNDGVGGNRNKILTNNSTRTVDKFRSSPEFDVLYCCITSLSRSLEKAGLFRDTVTSMARISSNPKVTSRQAETISRTKTEVIGPFSTLLTLSGVGGTTSAFRAWRRDENWRKLPEKPKSSVTPQDVNRNEVKSRVPANAPSGSALPLLLQAKTR